MVALATSSERLEAHGNPHAMLLTPVVIVPKTFMKLSLHLRCSHSPFTHSRNPLAAAPTSQTSQILQTCPLYWL